MPKVWITKHTHHQLPFQIVMFSTFCYLDVSKLQTQIGQLKLSCGNSNFNLHMYLTFSNNDYATHWYVNVKKNTRFEVQNDPSKKKNDVQQQLHWGKFVSQREVGKLKRQENLCLNDFPPKKKKTCMLIMMH